MKTKKELYVHFFNTIRMYMVNESVWNRYDDVILYWSYDTNQFLKRHEKNNNPKGNWVVIPHNKYEMIYLKQHLNLKRKSDISLSGRIIVDTFTKDDLWDKFMKYVNETFKNFYEIYDNKEENKIIETNEKSKPLF